MPARSTQRNSGALPMYTFGPEDELGREAQVVTYKARRPNTDEIFILRQFIADSGEGIPIQGIREVKALKKLNSKYVVRLEPVVISHRSLNTAYKYMPFTLKYLISSNFHFTEKHFQSITYQLVHAVSYVHSKGMMHRDLKPSHVLLDERCCLKLTGFGLAKEESFPVTNSVTSLHYRAPELLLGDTSYTNKIDSWALACILLEIKTGTPVFAGSDEIAQCKSILSTFGRPDVEYPWSAIYNVDKYAKPTGFDVLFKEKFGGLVDDSLLVILREMMWLDKNKRISVENVSTLAPINRGEKLSSLISLHEGE